jgi:hypothetical protein
MAGLRVDTRRVAHRRAVRLQTLGDLVAEVDRLAAAAEAGRVRCLGNWSAAQVFWHLAKFIECSLDGFPFRYRRGPEWITRLFRRFAWRWLIALALRPGFKNPPYAAVLEPEPSLSLADATRFLK